MHSLPGPRRPPIPQPAGRMRRAHPRAPNMSMLPGLRGPRTRAPETLDGASSCPRAQALWPPAARLPQLHWLRRWVLAGKARPLPPISRFPLRAAAAAGACQDMAGAQRRRGAADVGAQIAAAGGAGAIVTAGEGQTTGARARPVTPRHSI